MFHRSIHTPSHLATVTLVNRDQLDILASLRESVNEDKAGLETEVENELNISDSTSKRKAVEIIQRLQIRLVKDFRTSYPMEGDQINREGSASQNEDEMHRFEPRERSRTISATRKVQRDACLLSHSALAGVVMSAARTSFSTFLYQCKASPNSTLASRNGLRTQDYKFGGNGGMPAESD